MTWALVAVALLVGLIIGFVLALAWRRHQKSQLASLAEEIYNKNRDLAKAESVAMLETTKAAFQDLSMGTLQRSTTELLKLTETKLAGERELSQNELEGKKKLIDQQLANLTAELQKVSTMVKDFEKDRSTKFGELSQGIRAINEQTGQLSASTNSLREALSSSQSRGQWGQRMADDVLRLAGFVEGINYTSQATLGSAGTRPDYTFFLPNSQTVNMDVKFPLDNYIRAIEATSEPDRERHARDFMKDVKGHIKALASREYIQADGSTVDYVLLFIPNESVYSFMYTYDKTLVDSALSEHVILCSPMTLFAVLAVIRQAVQNFSLEQTSNEILGLFGTFRKQWTQFICKFDKLGDKISGLQDEFNALSTTRRKQLERPLEKIEDLRSQRAIPVQECPDEDDPAAEE
jgi:DNA recombination protein RmuC